MKFSARKYVFLRGKLTVLFYFRRFLKKWGSWTVLLKSMTWRLQQSLKDSQLHRSFMRFIMLQLWSFGLIRWVFFLCSVFLIWKCSTDFWVIFPTWISDWINVKHFPKSRQKTPYLAELEKRNTWFYKTA